MSFNGRGSRRFGSRNYRNSKPGYSRSPQNNRNRSRYNWSETDLVKSIEYSKQAPTQFNEAEYVSTNSFSNFQVCPQLVQSIQNKGYKTPTPIQDQSIPYIMAGRDIIGMANTGTGKTAAFLIPLINKVYKDKNQKVLIVAPTRELAEQIDNEFRFFVTNLRIYSALIIGGKGMKTQMMLLNRKPNFVIGTPGRLKDMINRKILNLSEFNNVVLDETDRMVDIGFINEIKLFISLLPKERQSLFFSATISKKVQEILQAFVQFPVTVSVKKGETVENVRQDVVRISGSQKKVDLLHDLLIKDGFQKVLIFANTKWGVQKLSDELVKRGFKADAIHGNKKQNQRHQILEKFRRDEIKILLATDVASRGLDIKDVSHVINYEFPASYDEYVHRIGRTGRANKKGTALTFVGA